MKYILYAVSIMSAGLTLYIFAGILSQIPEGSTRMDITKELGPTLLPIIIGYLCFLFGKDLN